MAPVHRNTIGKRMAAGRPYRSPPPIHRIESRERRLDMKLSALTLLAACGFGFVIGRVIDPPRLPIALAQTATAPAPPADGKLRIIVFGAHPDDAEYRGAGVAMKWAKMGHHVKLVSATNGDIGHWQMAGGPLALRRKKEVLEVDRRLGEIGRAHV